MKKKILYWFLKNKSCKPWSLCYNGGRFPLKTDEIWPFFMAEKLKTQKILGVGV